MATATQDKTQTPQQNKAAENNKKTGIQASSDLDQSIWGTDFNIDFAEPLFNVLENIFSFIGDVFNVETVEENVKKGQFSVPGKSSTTVFTGTTFVSDTKGRNQDVIDTYINVHTQITAIMAKYHDPDNAYDLKNEGITFAIEDKNGNDKDYTAYTKTDKFHAALYLMAYEDAGVRVSNAEELKKALGFNDSTKRGYKIYQEAREKFHEALDDERLEKIIDSLQSIDANFYEKNLSSGSPRARQTQEHLPLPNPTPVPDSLLRGHDTSSKKETTIDAAADPKGPEAQSSDIKDNPEVNKHDTGPSPQNQTNSSYTDYMRDSLGKENLKLLLGEETKLDQESLKQALQSFLLLNPKYSTSLHTQENVHAFNNLSRKIRDSLAKRGLLEKEPGPGLYAEAKDRQPDLLDTVKTTDSGHEPELGLDEKGLGDLGPGNLDDDWADINPEDLVIAESSDDGVHDRALSLDDASGFVDHANTREEKTEPYDSQTLLEGLLSRAIPRENISPEFISPPFRNVSSETENNEPITETLSLSDMSDEGEQTFNYNNPEINDVPISAEDAITPIEHVLNPQKNKFSYNNIILFRLSDDALKTLLLDPVTNDSDKKALNEAYASFLKLDPNHRSYSKAKEDAKRDFRKLHIAVLQSFKERGLLDDIDAQHHTDVWHEFANNKNAIQTHILDVPDASNYVDHTHDPDVRTIADSDILEEITVDQFDRHEFAGEESSAVFEYPSDLQIKNPTDDEDPFAGNLAKDDIPEIDPEDVISLDDEDDIPEIDPIHVITLAEASNNEPQDSGLEQLVREGLLRENPSSSIKQPVQKQKESYEGQIPLEIDYVFNQYGVVDFEIREATPEELAAREDREKRHRSKIAEQFDDVTPVNQVGKPKASEPKARETSAWNKIKGLFSGPGPSPHNE